MLRRAFRCGLALAATLLAGCVAPKVPKGDVFLSEHHDYGSIFTGPAMPGRVLGGFPRIRLDGPKRVVVRVRDLPEPMVPSWAHIVVNADEDSRWVQTQPWRQARLRFTLRRPDGTLAFTRNYDLSRDWPGASQPVGRNQRGLAIMIWNEREVNARQRLKDYDFIVEVVRPSALPTDELQIEGAFSPFGVRSAASLLPPSM